MGDTVSAYDAVVILTDHDAVDFDLIARQARLVVDTRNALSAGPRVVKA